MHRLVAPRDQKYQSNFVEFRNSKIVYRRYAGLFFCACVDANDNELAYLEAIHFFVEVLDSFFGNVCELDLVFNFYKVREGGDERAEYGMNSKESERGWLWNKRCHMPKRDFEVESVLLSRRAWRKGIGTLSNKPKSRFTQSSTRSSWLARSKRQVSK